mgnify:CR=1 FL=1
MVKAATNSFTYCLELNVLLYETLGKYHHGVVKAVQKKVICPFFCPFFGVDYGYHGQLEAI